MGKLNVSMLRYLTREDFRVLTAVRIQIFVVHLLESCINYMFFF